MSGPVRVTNPLLNVLELFLQAHNDDQELHGWAMLKATGHSGPTIYGVLDRLEDAGWITGRWEDQAADANTPRRRLYRLTPTGITGSEDLLAARRPAALSRLRHQPRPGPAYIGWLRRLIGGAS